MSWPFLRPPHTTGLASRHCPATATLTTLILIEARRSLRAETLAEHVSRVIAEAPPLSDEQLSRIAALLRAGGGVPTGRQAAVHARLTQLDGGGGNAA